MMSDEIGGAGSTHDRHERCVAETFEMNKPLGGSRGRVLKGNIEK
jgi:hypothetical protein